MASLENNTSTYAQTVRIELFSGIASSRELHVRTKHLIVQFCDFELLEGCHGVGGTAHDREVAQSLGIGSHGSAGQRH